MQSDKEKIKIIIAIDDEPQNLELVEFYMRNTDYVVRSFPSGIPALKYMDSTSDDIALVIVDIMMPEMSGYEVCSAIRSRPKYKFLPILVSSGLSSSPDKVKAMESGADDFVTKPLDRQTLMIRVKSLVRIGDLYNDLIFKNHQLEAAVEKLKVAQDTIIQNEKYISIVAMAQGMAHEIYNPLTIINGNVERMLIKIKNQEIGSEFLAEMAASIKSASSRCVKIIESLQLYSS
ncbi:MAG TPA: response regulator, partial [Candidatus Wallbacteria bacterium]|nr:response regulator [Candidatus Wallbacteria bacterium]